MGAETAGEGDGGRWEEGTKNSENLKTTGCFCQFRKNLVTKIFILIGDSLEPL